MSSQQVIAESQSESADRDPSTGSDREIDAGVLEVLTDNYTREIIRELRDGPRPARALIDRSGASKPTVYRRLDRLESTGLIESRMTVHPDGHHRHQYRMVVDRIIVDLDRELHVRTKRTPAE